MSVNQNPTCVIRSILRNFVLTPCKTIAGGMIQLRAMEKVKAELEALLEQDSENDNKENIEQNIKKISLDNVGQKISDNFSLDKLTMTFEKGKKYAIVGKSGSGKSSIIKLLTEYNYPKQPGKLHCLQKKLTPVPNIKFWTNLHSSGIQNR